MKKRKHTVKTVLIDNHLEVKYQKVKISKKNFQKPIYD